MRAAVVGTGFAGIVTLYTIQKRLLNNVKFSGKLEVVAFERGDQMGGEWIFSDKQPETYVQDLPMSSSIYRGLQTNDARPLTEVHPDFPWQEGTPDYPTHEEQLAYMQSFCEKFDLSRFVRLSTVVTNVRRDDDGECEKLILEAKNIKNGEVTTEKFDYVFICTGNNRKPVIPTDVDTAEFKGTVMHYHDMKDPERLRGKRVVVIGTSFGAADLAIMLNDRAEKLYFSWNKHKPFWHNENKLKSELKPKMVKAVGSTVQFADGSSAEIDVILYATGFHIVDPLIGDLFLDCNVVSCLFPIYKHVVHPNCPNIFFIGRSYAYAMPLSRIQSEFTCAIIDGRVALPSKEEMLADIAAFQAKWLPELATMFDGDITKKFPVIDIDFELSKSLAAFTGCEPMTDYLHQLIYSSLRLLKDDVLHYRSYRLVDRSQVDSSYGNIFASTEE